LAVKLRLKRMGKKRQPVYKVVAADVRSPRDGKFIESIGLYNPKTHPATVDINEDRALYWLSVGAQPTNTVKNLLSERGILLKRDMLKRGKSEDEINSAVEELIKIKEAAGKKKAKSVKVEAELKKEEKITESKEESAPEVTGTASDVSAEEQTESE